MSLDVLASCDRIFTNCLVIMKNLEQHLNALQVIIISLVLFGAFGMQYIFNEAPCPLCLLQRLGMLGVGVGALMNLRYGIQRKHYAISMLAAFFGGFVALRQILLHVCPGSPKFGMPFLGLSLYTWSFLVFVCSILLVAIVMIVFKEKTPITVSKVAVWHKVAFALLFLAAFTNILEAHYLCGFGACVS